MVPRPASPAESINRAWAVATRLLDDIRTYLASPTAPEDRGRSFHDLNERVGRLSADLERVRPLLAAAYDDTPSREVLTVLRSVDQLVVDVQVHTFMKHVSNPEEGLIELRACLARAA